MIKRKPSFSQLMKYNTSQKLLKTLADAQARAILFSMIEEGKTTIDLYDEHRIPLSSIYKKISELEELTLIKVEKRIISDNGKKFNVYKSQINGADISMRSIDPVINLHTNSGKH